MTPLAWRRVRVEAPEGGEPRFGLLLEADGRSLIALGAVSERELDEQLQACGGPVGYARRFGAEPLDPQGLAADASGAPVWIPR